jgi:glycosyltransferase involved in cell wall biosynthesis
LRVAVIIPVFNERDSLPLVVGDIPRGLVAEIVVVDNGSTDGTDLVAQNLGANGDSLPVRLVREARRGYGSACLAGIAALEASPPDVVVFLDGDYSDHPEEMLELLTPIDLGADLVVGSRTLGRHEPGALLPQARLGNLLACFLIRVLYGYRYTDLGPFRAIRWDALRRLRMRDRMDLRDAGQGAPGRPVPRRSPRLLSPPRGRLQDHGNGVRHAPGRLEDPVDDCQEPQGVSRPA